MYLNILLGSVEQGLLYSIMVLGVYLTFRVLDYADLTVDGSFPLGAAVAAILIVSGHNPLFATLSAIAAGAVAGMITGALHTQFKIAPLLSGILSMIALYSVNLRVMGRANISLLRQNTVYTQLAGLGLSDSWVVIAVGVIAAVGMVAVLWWFLNTELGFAMRATGDNAQMIRSLGVNTNAMKIIGLSISNAMVAFSGALVTQYQSFADVGMGIGMIVVGLASVIIGEVLFGTTTIFRTLVAVAMGSVVYRLVIAIVLQLGLKPTDLKLFTALIVTIALASPIMKGKLQVALGRRKDGHNA